MCAVALYDVYIKVMPIKGVYKKKNTVFIWYITYTYNKYDVRPSLTFGLLAAELITNIKNVDEEKFTSSHPLLIQTKASGTLDPTKRHALVPLGPHLLFLVTIYFEFIHKHGEPIYVPFRWL